MSDDREKPLATKSETRGLLHPLLTASCGGTILAALALSNPAIAGHTPVVESGADEAPSIAHAGEALAAAAEDAARRLDLAAAIDAARHWDGLRDRDIARSRRVWGALAGAAFASGDFGLAATAAARWQVVSETVGATDAKNMLSIARILADVPRQRVEAYAPKRIAVLKDAVGLSRAAIAVNGTAIDAVLDTGANISTVSESTARRLGLHLLSGDAAVGSSTRVAVETKLALADRLDLAGVTLRNVVFLVLPDAQLKLPVPDYKLEIIVGFPVFRAVERLNFDRDGGFTPARSQDDGGHANIHFKGSSIYVETKVESRPVAMHLDTGARGTSLPGSFAIANPELIKGLEPVTIKVGGAGGVAEQQAVELRDTAVEIDGHVVRLDGITVALGEGGDAAISRTPQLGQDILSRLDAYAIDIPARRFVVTRPRP